jgi:hypothetical protein
VLRNLLTELTGNTHRVELFIDKFYSPYSAAGRQGLVELGAFEMQAGARAEQDCAAPGRAAAIGGSRGGSPRWLRTSSTGAASATNAMMRRSAPQFGQVSGSDSNSRASSIAQR